MPRPAPGAATHALRARERVRAFLAGVHAAAETLLQHGAALQAADREHLEVLLIGEAQRAGRLVDDLLTMARLDAGVQPVWASVDLGQLAEAEVDRARLLSPSP